MMMLIMMSITMSMTNTMRRNSEDCISVSVYTGTPHAALAVWYTCLSRAVL